jgi:hypothetical protein
MEKCDKYNRFKIILIKLETTNLNISKIFKDNHIEKISTEFIV